jgi:hypothetical protein
MIINLYSILTFLFISLHGRGLFLIIKKLFKVNFFNSNLTITPVYGLISIFVLTNQLIILNFFYSLNEILTPFWIVNFFIACVGLNKITIGIKKIYVLFIPFILSISSYGQKVNVDVETYAILHQFLLRNSEILFGHINIFWRLGLNSSLSYLNASLWLDNDFLLNHLLVVSIFSLFFTFLYEGLFISKNKFYFFFSLYLIIYSLLDNFGINGGANGFVSFQMTGAVDSVIAIYFVFSVFYTFYLLNIQEIKKVDYLIVSALILFTFQLKTTGAFIFVTYIILNIFYLKFNTISVNEFLKTNTILYIVGLLYLLKNTLSTGCLVYPVGFTCIKKLPWYKEGLYSRTSELAGDWYLAYNFKDNLVEWFQIWFQQPKNYQTFGNFLISIFALLIFYLIFVEKNYSKNYLFFILQVFVGFLFLIATVPTPRFAFGLFTLSSGLFAFFSKDLKYKIPINNLVLLLIFCLSLSLTNRLYSYQLYFESPTEQVEVKSQILINLKKDSSLVIPKELIIMKNCKYVNNCSIDFSIFQTKEFYTYKYIINDDFRLPITATHGEYWEDFIFKNN